jgi:hypothetical protein
LANPENLIGKGYKPGQSGNPAGRPKGTRSWSTVIQNLLDDPDMAEALLQKKPGWWDKLPNKNMSHVIAMAMMAKAASGDHKAATWLTKSGFGDKVDVTSGGEKIELPAVYLPNRNKDDKE